jgi:uncharacterized protein
MKSNIVMLAALLHDVDDVKISPKTSINKDNARMFLSNNKVDSQTIDFICNIIDEISYKGKDSITPKTLEGKIVQDADRLDAIGAIGIIRTIEYGASKQRQFYEEANLEHNESKICFKESTNTSLSHFYDKLLKLKDYMHTYTAKKIAEERHEFMLKFLEEFYSEIK